MAPVVIMCSACLPNIINRTTFNIIKNLEIHANLIIKHFLRYGGILLYAYFGSNILAIIGYQIIASIYWYIVVIDSKAGDFRGVNFRLSEKVKRKNVFTSENFLSMIAKPANSRGMYLFKISGKGRGRGNWTSGTLLQNLW